MMFFPEPDVPSVKNTLVEEVVLGTNFFPQNTFEEDVPERVGAKETELCIRKHLPEPFQRKKIKGLEQDRPVAEVLFIKTDKIANVKKTGEKTRALDFDNQKISWGS
jgi:hypothetical protein